MTTTLTIIEQRLFYDAFVPAFAMWQAAAADLEYQAGAGINAGASGYVTPAPTTVTLPFTVPPQSPVAGKAHQGVHWAFEKAIAEAYGVLADMRNAADIAVTRRLALAIPDTDFADVVGQLFGDYDVPTLASP